MSRGTLDPARPISLRIPGYHRLWPAFPGRSARVLFLNAVLNPEHIATLGLASAAFARHYARYLG